MKNIRELLGELSETNLLRITGSFSDGTQKENSDIDFFVKPDKPDTAFTERNMLKIISILKKHGIKWNSTRVGYISTIHSDNPYLPIELEFSDQFKPRKNKLKEVILFGVEFKTY